MAGSGAHADCPMPVARFSRTVPLLTSRRHIDLLRVCGATGRPS